jgi:restriction system protein
MGNFWMVRAGEGGRVADDFRREGAVALNFGGRDLSHAATRDDIRPLVEAEFQDRKPGFYPVAVGTLFKFRSLMQCGDPVLTYDPVRRKYLLGEITGDYELRPGLIPDHEQVRRVKWLGEVSRDALSQSARNTLGSTVAVFSPGDEVLVELREKLGDNAVPPTPRQIKAAPPDIPIDDVDDIRRDVIDKSHEFIKDRIAKLDWEEMQELMAGILRAMGFKTRVSPVGPDRGKDIFASPDGLGLSPPRIKVEVKHRTNTQIGSSDVRSFLGGLRGEDRGLYVSTGGFTREAHYEAERAPVPVHLIDLDQLAVLVVQNYDQMDNEGRAIVPLTRFYWPASTD